MKTFFDKLILLILIFAVQCSPDGPHQPVSAGGPKPSSVSSAGYNEIRPIFAQYCSECHPSRSPPDWLNYTDAKSRVTNGRLYLRIGSQRSMPPPGTPQAVNLSDTDRKKIADWALAGGPINAVTAAVSDSGNLSAPVTNNPAVQSCFQCHGPDGASDDKPSIPSLAGQNSDYIVLQLNNFQFGQRTDPSDTMRAVAARLTQSQKKQAAEFFCRRPAAKGMGLESLPLNEKFLYARGEKLGQQACASCHMNPEYNNGTTVTLLPILAGQSKQYLMDQLIYFRNGSRKSGTMLQFARNLTDKDIEALATYFSNVRVEVAPAAAVDQTR
jgi:cytochrome c553